MCCIWFLQEPFSVMADSAVAMRDPTFYRWHSYIDDLFQLYKYNLPPYGDKVTRLKNYVVYVTLRKKKI